MSPDQLGQHRGASCEKLFDEIFVLLHNLRLSELCQNFASKNHHHVTGQPLPKRDNDGVFRGEANLIVEREICFVDAGPITAPNSVFHQFELRLQALQPLGPGAVIGDCVARRDGLQRSAYLAHLIDTRIVKFNDPNATILSAVENSLRLENFERLSQGHTAHCKTPRYLDFDEPLSGIQGPPSNPFDDGIRNLFGQASHLHEL